MPTVLLSGSPILDIDATFLVYLGVFGLLFFVLRALVFRPAMALFDAREEAIGGAKAKARKLEQEAEEKLASFESEMTRVRSEAALERDRLRADSQKRERALLDKVKAETDALLREADAKMAAEAASLRKEISATAPALAGQIANQLLGREVKA